jgi:hypothetical protein
MSNTLLNKINRQLTKLEKEVELTTSYIPDGYQVAKKSLSGRVKLMAEGLYAMLKDREELGEENKKLKRVIYNSRVVYNDTTNSLEDTAKKMYQILGEVEL